MGLFWPEPQPASGAQSLGETESMEQVEAAHFFLGPNSGSPTSPHLLQPLKDPKEGLFSILLRRSLSFYLLWSEGDVSERSKDLKFYSLLKILQSSEICGYYGPRSLKKRCKLRRSYLWSREHPNPLQYPGASVSMG